MKLKSSAGFMADDQRMFRQISNKMYEKVALRAKMLLAFANHEILYCNIPNFIFLKGLFTPDTRNQYH